MEKMSHEQMMEKAWRFIHDMEISENKEEQAEYYVKNIHHVRDAYYADLESGHNFEGESLEQFFKRHNINYED